MVSTTKFWKKTYLWFFFAQIDGYAPKDGYMSDASRSDDSQSADGSKKLNKLCK